MAKTFHPHRVSKRAGELQIGEMGYMRPMDIHMTLDLRGYIQPDAHVAPTHNGPHPVEVTRDERGIVIEITAVPYVWHPEMDHVPSGALEVVEIIDDAGDSR